MKKNREKKNKQPWPTKAVMEQIYKLHLWGTHTDDFYSGHGSHAVEIVVPYVNVVREFFMSFETPLTVCDLGCGDFNIGKQLVSYTKKYYAIDIVADLIAHLKQKFQAPELEFLCLDIATEEIPAGDCVLIRQVLQHLSNNEIQQILPKLRSFQYVILTEHVPQGDFVPNIDIISGQGIRLKKNSGVDLRAAPFRLEVKKETTLLTVSPKEYDGVIVTKLLEMK